jgi:hypothetical protein
MVLKLPQNQLQQDKHKVSWLFKVLINPQNYPIDPADIGWTGLQTTAQGGQPSFAQIAPGGSVNWNGGASVTTQTATTQAQMTSTSNHWFGLGGNRNLCILLRSRLGRQRITWWVWQ